MTTQPKPTAPPLEWPEEDQHLVPFDRRRFGPYFEKPCFNPDTIVCAARSCQQVYKCRYGLRPANKKKPENR